MITTDNDLNLSEMSLLCFDREMDCDSSVIISMSGNQTTIESNKVRFGTFSKVLPTIFVFALPAHHLPMCF